MIQTSDKPTWLDNSLIFLPIISVFLWTHGIEGFSGYYGQDSHAYLDYTKRILTFFDGGPRPGSFFWPINFPLAGALIAGFLPALSWCLPLISLTCFLLLAWCFRAALLRNFQTDALSASLFTLATLGISPVMLRAAQLGMSDLMAILLVFCAWDRAYRFGKSGSRRHIILAATFAGLAIGTRYASVILLILPGLEVVKTCFRQRTWPWLLPAALLGFACLSPTWWFTGIFPTLADHTASHHFSLLHWFQSDFPNHPDGHLSYAQINLIYAASPFFRPDYCFLIVPLVLLLGPSNFKTVAQRSSWIIALIYLVFVAGLEMQNPRFLLPALPFLLFPLFPSWTRIFALLGNPFLKILAASGWLLFSMLLYSRLITPMIDRNHLEQSIAIRLNALPPTPIYTFAMDVALPTYGVKNPLINLWEAPIHSFQTGAFALFNETRFGQQWQGKLPMENWRRLKNAHPLVLINDFGQGWQLFRIGPPHH